MAPLPQQGGVQMAPVVYAQPQVVQPTQVYGQPAAVYGQQPVYGQQQQVYQPVVVQPQVVQQFLPPATVSGLNDVLNQYAALKVIQKFELLEAVSQGCCEMPNTYRVFGGPTLETATEEILVATEHSKGCTRVCCAPGHGTLIYVRHATQKDHVFMTLERPGLECCFNGNGFGAKPCLCCWAVTESCTDGVILHDGQKDGRIGVGELGDGVASVWQPDGGGGCLTPTLHIADGSMDKTKIQGGPGALGTVTGPTILGGCTELCCDASFLWKSPDKQYTYGRIVHLRPPCCTAACCMELWTDSDKFGIELDPQMPLDTKAKALATTLLIDYMFFERDNGILTCQPSRPPKSGCTIKITICLCYCCGCLCPCNLSVPFEQGGGGSD